MKKAKQILSILLAVFMVLSAVPVAFAAGDGEQKTVDLSGDTFVSLGSGYEYYDEDGYILTGSSDDGWVDVYESSDLTLMNATFQHLVTQYAPEDSVINITLEGANEVAGFIGFMKEHLIFNGSEGATLETPYIYTNGGKGTATVNGGNIILDFVTEKNVPTIECNGGFTINGGTVTASNNYYCVVYGSVTLNGGELNIISTSTDYEAIIGSIIIEKGALLTVSATKGILDMDSDIVMADDAEENDSFFVRYDTESEFVPVADIKAALDGKIYAEIKIDTHTHSYTDGICGCGHACTHENMTDGKCTDCDFECTAHDWSNKNGVCAVCGVECEHDWRNADGICAVCGVECEHDWTNADGICAVCAYECSHENYTDEACPDCGFECTAHDWSNEDGVCAVCGVECEHDWRNADSICAVCGFECPHENYADGECLDCGAVGTLLKISMHDSYGDGWDGNGLLIKTVSGEEIDIVTFSDGYDDTYTILLAEDVIFTLTWQEDSYADECSFEVAVDGETVYECTDGSTLNDGKVFYSICEHTFNTDGKCNVCGFECPHEYYADGECPDCGIKGMFIEITMYDSYGDGWDGNGLLIKTVSGEEIGVATFDEGYDDTYTFLLAEDVKFTLTWQKNDYPDECTFEVAVDGETVFESERGDNYEDGEVVYIYCDHEFVNGVCTKCGSPCLHDTDNGECSLCGKYLYAITHQPTEAEPYVELNNDTDASYQWYVFERKTVEITDENAVAITPENFDFPAEMFTQLASYDADNGWQSSVAPHESGNAHLFFAADLKAGDVVNVTFSAAPDDSILLTIDADKIADAETEDGINYSFTVLEDGLYGLQALCNDPLSAKASMLTDVGSILEGETDARLQNPEFGAEYLCEVTFADGTSEVSDAFEYKYAITHQPTEEEPYVELNYATDASYQWHTVEGGIVEITDEKATGDWGLLGAPSEIYGEYDSEIGWTSPEGYYFVIELQEGETVELETSESVSEWWIAYAQNPGMYTDYWTVEQYGTTISLTATADGYYGFSIPNVPGVAVRAYMEGSVYTAIDSQTTDTLTPDAIGHYACKVTFADGTTEMSDTFEVTSVHTCDFSGDWVYDNAKHWKECTVDGCSAVSEETEHEFLDGECTVCDYVCDHANATEELIRPVQNADGTWGQGSIVTTCPDCENVDTEYVNRADYTAFDAAVAKLQAILAREDLVNGPKSGYAASLNTVINAIGYNRVVTEQNNVNTGTGTINDFIAALEAGLADNTMKKADLSYMTALLDEVNALIDRNLSNIIPSESGRYTGPYGFYMAAINNGNYSQADYDRRMAEYDYENQLETLIAGLKDGTMRKADYTEIDEVIAGIDEALKTATVSDEMQAELDGIKKELDALKSDVNTSAADLANSGLLDRAKAIATTMADCANGVHSFTKYEEVTSPDCDDAGKEVAVCDNGCGATDEKAIDALGHTELPAVKENEVKPDCENAGSYDLVVYCYVCDKEISRVTETVDALGHTELPAVKENEVKPDCENAGSYDLVVYCDVCGEEISRVTETVDALGHSFTLYTVTVAPTCEEAGKQISVCDNGCGATDEQAISALGHSFTEYVSNNDASCEADGTKTAHCDNGCGKINTVTDKGSKLDHVDANGDDVCDDCHSDLHVSVEDCECTCHRTDIFNRFVYKILQFIRKLFGINSKCDCGTVHTEGLTPFWAIVDFIAE